MNESLVAQVRELLTQNESAGIIVGRNPSVDAMGSALALYLALQNSGKSTVIASATTPLVEHSSLVGIDKVKGSFEGEGGDLIVSFPYREGEIDKVSYTLEEGFLNIVVKPGELGLNFSENDVIYRRKGAYPGVIFTIGVQNLSDISSVVDLEELKNTQIVNIDNSVQNQSFGDVVMIDSASSSIAEQIEGLISNLGMEIDLDVAQNLLSAVSFATNNFQNPNTTPFAFSLAASLMQRGARRQSLPQKRVENERQDPGEVLEILSKIQNQQPRDQKRRDERGNLPLRNPNQFSQQNQRHHQNPNPNQNSQSQPQNQQQDQSNQNPPEDWLTPKVYKGSTNV